MDLSDNVQPFLDICVQPYYGSLSALVTWTLMEPFRKGDIYVFRSETGEKPWVLLNREPVRRTGAFRDDSMRVVSQDVVPHYRLLLEMDAQQFKSPPVGVFSNLSRSEYRGVFLMMSAEMRRMRKNATPVWHCIPLTSGEPNPNFDAQTGQEWSVDCPTSDTQSFGLPFKGGYGPPSPSYAEKGQVVISTKDGPNDEGTEQTTSCTARLPAYPQPARGQMLVDPKVDERWVIGEDIKPYLFAGRAAIAYEVPLQLIKRTDPRYRFSVPPLLSKP